MQEKCVLKTSHNVGISGSIPLLLVSCFMLSLTSCPPPGVTTFLVCLLLIFYILTFSRSLQAGHMMHRVLILMRMFSCEVVGTQWCRKWLCHDDICVTIYIIIGTANAGHRGDDLRLQVTRYP